MTTLITLTNVGIDAGPFNLYSNADDYDQPFDTDISAEDLIAGYTTSFVPNDATIIRVVSMGVCGNYINIVINNDPCLIVGTAAFAITTTTTSTTAVPTTTTTSSSTTTSTSSTTTTTSTTVALNTFNVTNDGSGNYVINGESNPTLNVNEGQTYTFNISAIGHPFWIKTVNSIGTGNAYNDGVTSNGIDNGTITFVVPYDAPSTLYYNCEFHSSMAGIINVTNVITTTTTTTI